MCFVKTEDMSWPHIITGLPTCGNKSAKISEGTKSATITLSLEEVYHFRNEVVPVGQCALHMALQRNLPLQVIRVIVESDPSTLMVSDNNGEIPLMTALRHGLPMKTIEYLVDQDFSTLYARNFEGKVPLHLAIDFACSSVQSTRLLDNGTTRVTTRGAHPDQAESDENSLAIVEYLLKRGPFSADMGDVHDSSPLYTAVSHQGPGRIETFEAMRRGFAYIREKGLCQIPNLLQNSCRRHRLHDKETPLHVVCRPSHFSPYLISTIMKLNPISVIIKNNMNQTPLHILCDPYQDSDRAERRRNTLDQTELNSLILELVKVTPQALRICDHMNRLPIHVYLESSYIDPKDPIVLSHMLKLYPQSCWIESPTYGPISYMVTKDALLSENSNGFVPFVEVLDDKEVTLYPEVIDPTLVCLWLVLNHCHTGDFSFQPRLEVNAIYSLEAIHVFLSQMSKEVLHGSRYEANIRCVGRIVANSLVSASYRKSLLSVVIGTLPPEPMAEDEIWPCLVVKEMQRTIETCDFSALKHEVINNIYRDNNTVSMILLCPQFDRITMMLVFPTITPNMITPSHSFCPFYKSMALYKFLTRKSLPCQLNFEASNIVAQLTPPQLLHARFGQLTHFMEEDGDIFPHEIHELMESMSQRLDNYLYDDSVAVC